MKVEYKLNYLFTINKLIKILLMCGLFVKLLNKITINK
jgi:hypothetical protein